MREGFKEELGTLLNQLYGKMDIQAHQTDQLFRLHNEYYVNQQEHGKSCGSCRSRVYKKMMKVGEELKLKVGE